MTASPDSYMWLPALKTVEVSSFKRTYTLPAQSINTIVL